MNCGRDLVELAAKHVRHPAEPYVFGAIAPKNQPAYRGPWDCAEFGTAVYYWGSGRLYGCADNRADPELADAGTIYWSQDARKLGKIIPVAEAVNIPGAFVLRLAASGACGHLVISTGLGTIEAHSSATGVIRSILAHRRWDLAILPPGIAYEKLGSAVLPPVPEIYYLTWPLMRAPKVGEIAAALQDLGYDTGTPRDIFGHQTFAAVLLFQRARGLVADGEVGPETAKALGVKL